MRLPFGGGRPVLSTVLRPDGESLMQDILARDRAARGSGRDIQATRSDDSRRFVRGAAAGDRRFAGAGAEAGSEGGQQGDRGPQSRLDAVLREVDGGRRFLYDAVLSAIENADWEDALVGERAYKLLVAFKGRHLDFFGSNKNQRLALRTNLTRLTTLVEYLMSLEDRQLFTVQRSMYQGRFGEIVCGHAAGRVQPAQQLAG